jgi:hydroxysqualene synthase
MARPGGDEDVSVEAIEVPITRGADKENFPVGSWLLPRHLRGHIMTFYAFARAADDIADSKDLLPAQKLERLDRFERALRHGSDCSRMEKAAAMRASLEETGVPMQHCLDLLSAFKQDAVKTRYASWAELMDYCNRSAAPVGRFLLDLHDEDRATWAASDALCNALQVLNHLQDCGEDYRALDRVYLPQDWLEATGATVDDLRRPTSTEALSRVIRRCVRDTAKLITLAQGLPDQIESRHLAGESQTIVRIAEKLANRLYHRDPLSERVALGTWDYATAFGAGLKTFFRLR